MLRCVCCTFRCSTAVEDVHIAVIGDVLSAHRLQVGSLKLAVYKQAASLLQNLRQTDEGEFGGVGYEREHAFAEERITQAHPIESAHQPVFF